MTHPEISEQTVLQLARLARLRLTEAELPRLTADLQKILAHVRSLDEVETEGVEPTAHVLIERLPLRDDEPRAGLDREVVLEQAPRHTGEGFSVPTFVEE